jgi:hypothetical protein
MPHEGTCDEKLGISELHGSASYDGVTYFGEYLKYDWPKSEDDKIKVQVLQS